MENPLITRYPAFRSALTLYWAEVTTQARREEAVTTLGLALLTAARPPIALRAPSLLAVVEAQTFILQGATAAML